MLDSLVIIDFEGTILFANDAAFKLVEVEKEEFINQKKISWNSWIATALKNRLVLSV
jgi:PAS domain-containing protein